MSREYWSLGRTEAVDWDEIDRLSKRQPPPSGMALVLGEERRETQQTLCRMDTRNGNHPALPCGPHCLRYEELMPGRMCPEPECRRYPGHEGLHMNNGDSWGEWPEVFAAIHDPLKVRDNLTGELSEFTPSPSQLALMDMANTEAGAAGDSPVVRTDPSIPEDAIAVVYYRRPDMRMFRVIRRVDECRGMTLTDAERGPACTDEQWLELCSLVKPSEPARLAYRLGCGGHLEGEMLCGPCLNAKALNWPVHDVSMRPRK